MKKHSAKHTSPALPNAIRRHGSQLGGFCNEGLHGRLSFWCCRCRKQQVKPCAVSQTYMHKQATHTEGAVLQLFVRRYNRREGTSGLFLQICVHASKCVHLTHQGVCPIWSVLANFILLCLHGKRSKANIETRVMACFALGPNCPSIGLFREAWLNQLYLSDMVIEMKFSSLTTFLTQLCSTFDSFGNSGVYVQGWTRCLHLWEGCCQEDSWY